MADNTLTNHGYSIADHSSEIRQILAPLKGFIQEILGRHYPQYI